MSRWALLLISLTVVVGSCRDADPADEEGEGALDADKDDATLRRRAMNEWYTESPAPREGQAWSRDYRQYILEEAKAERQRWGRLLPQPQDRFKVPLVNGTTWTNLGPTEAQVLKNGSTTLNVTDSGRVRSIVADGARIFVATAGGGAWRSSDGGATWTPLTETLGTLSCGSLAMDPTNHDTLYLGLGDPFDGTGIGLVKTTDAGNTWSEPVFLGDATVIPQVLVDPANASIVLAATNKGLYRSTDGGATWSLVTLATGQAEKPSVWSIASTGGSKFVLSLEAAPSATTGTTDGQVWWSSNDGATWTRATGFTKNTGIGRATVASAPSSPLTVYAMAAIPLSSSASDLADLFKSTNGGQTWTALAITNKRYSNQNSESSRVNTLLNGQGWYNQLVLVNPTNPNIVYFGGALLLARTSDGGSTYAQVSNWLAQFSLPYVHADFHAGTFNANGDLYVGSDGGVFKSTNGGTTFTDTLNKGMITHLLYSVGSSQQSSSAVIGGMQDNGTRVRVGTSSVFNEYIGGDGFGSDVNKTNAQQMLGSLYYDRIYKSTNGGVDFVASSTGITESNNSSSAPFITRIVPWEGSATGNDVYTFSNLKVYRSTNYAGSWTSIGTPLTTGSIRHIGVARSNASVIGVVASGGRVFLSSNGGTSFTLVASGGRDDNPVPNPAPLPNGLLSLSYIHFDTTNSNIVYVASVAPDASATHLWKSTDFGASWAAIDGGGLPAGVPVNIIKSDPTEQSAGQALYAGTHMGVYKSNDGGASWTRFGAGMPLVSVMDLYISADAQLVRAASYGRGFWELGGSAPAGDFTVSATPASRSVNQGGSTTFDVATGVTGAAQTVSFSASGLPAGASATFSPTSVTAGNGSTLTVATAGSTPAGTYTITVTGTGSSATHATTVSLTVAAVSDFSIAATPPGVSAVQGGSTQTTIGTTVTSGSTQPVSLAVTSALPAGVVASFSATSINAGQSSTLTLATSAGTPVGNYTVTVTGTGTTATKTVDVAFAVTAPVANDFSMGATAASVAQGGSGTSTISTAVTSGVAQNVDLSVTSALPAGVTATLSPASVTAGGSATLTIAAGATAAPGSYSITVTGAGTSATHTATVALTVVASDFSMSATAASVAQGGATTSTVSTAVTSGIAQTVGLAVTSTLPTGVTASLSPSSVTAGGSSTMTISASASAVPGSYAITVTGTGASATKTTNVSLTVTAASGDTILSSGVPVTGLSGALNSQKFFRLDVPAGTVALTFVTSGGTGDADMYVKFGAHPTTSSYDCRPFVNGNNETCNITAIQAGSYYVMLNGFSAYSGVTLTGTMAQAATLTRGQPISGISGALNSKQYWRLVTVPAGASGTIAISGGTGDADLYVRRGSAPTTSTYDCRPFVNGNNESCPISNTTGAPVDYYILLNGFSAYSGVTLSGNY